METLYSIAWKEYLKSKEYETSAAALAKKGVKQPYLNNILQSAFAAGWNALEGHQINESYEKYKSSMLKENKKIMRDIENNF